MKKSDLNKNGRVMASILRFIGALNFIGGIILGIILIKAAAIPGETTRFGYVAGGTDSTMIVYGITVMFAGLVGMIVILALAYVCEAVAQLHAE